MKKLSKMPLVKVFWVDSSSVRGWIHLSEMEKPPPLECISCGFLVRKTKHVVDISSHVALHDKGVVASVHSIMTIPRCSVTKLEYLDE